MCDTEFRAAQEVGLDILPASLAVREMQARAPARMPKLLPTPPSASPGDQIATIYRTYYPLLAYVAARKFGVPDADIADLIHEVVLAYIRAQGRVYDERGWLVGTMCNTCREYRARMRDDPPPSRDAIAEVACDPEDVSRRVDLSAILRRVPRKCREVLRLRFIDELTSEEIASHFETTASYARRMVYRCVGKARALALELRRS